MKAQDIILQLYKNLPRLTGLFSDDLPVSSMTSVGTTVTVVTSTDHNLRTGALITVSGVRVPISITSLTQVDNIATVETATNHDLTEDWQTEGIISGANEADYNGTKILDEVQNRNKFSYLIENDPSSPATGTPIYEEILPNGYNGIFSITKINDTTFTYEMEVTLPSPAIISDANIRVPSRISGIISIQRAIESYTKQSIDKFYAFVSLGPSVASKDRATLSDAVMTAGAGDDPRQRTIQDISIFVFAPATNEVAARKVRDDMEDVNLFFAKSLLGYRPPSAYTEEASSGITFVGHRTVLFNNAIYIHEFQYEVFFDITIDDTIINEPITKAFRDIQMNFRDPLVIDGDDIIMSATINLDKEE